MRKLFVVGVFGLLAGCSAPLEELAYDLAKKTDSISNPDAAQFRNLRKGGGGVQLCGEIKQVVGGNMTSWAPFIGEAKGLSLVNLDGSTSWAASAWDIYCK